MAITAEQLNVILSARDREFTRAMERAQRRVDRFSRQSNQSLTSVSGSFRAMAAAARTFLPALSAGAVVAQVRRVVSEVSQIQLLSDIAGTTAEEFQRFAAGAETVGFAMDRTADILKDVNDKIGDFLATGAGPMADFFENIAPQVGVTADQFARLSGPQALQLYVDSLERAGVGQQEMTFYMEALASDATALLPLLSDNAAEMTRLGDEAFEAGRILDNEMVASARETEVALSQMAGEIRGDLSRALINLAPLLTGAARGVALITENIAYLFSAMDEGLARTQSLEQLGTQLQQINAQIAEAEASGGAVAVDEFNMGSSAANLNDLLQQREAILERISGLQSEIVESQPPIEVVTGGADLSALQSQVEAQEELARLAAMTAEERERARIEAEADALVQEALAQRQGDLMLPANIEAAIAAAELREQYVAAATAASSILNPIQAAGGATREVADAAEDAAINLEEMIQNMIEASPLLQGLGFDAETLQGTMQTVEGSMESAFMSIMDGTASAKDAFRVMAADIIRELYRVLVVQRLVGSFEAGGGGILGSVFSAFGGATGAASGRPVQRGQPYTVGEHGRELFVPSSAGRVLSVPQAKAAVAGNQGQPVVVNYTFQGGVTEADLSRAMPMLVERTKREVVEAVQRGGSVARVFG